MRSHIAVMTAVVVMAGLFLATGAVAQTPATPVMPAPNIPLIGGATPTTAVRPAVVVWMYPDGSFEVKDELGRKLDQAKNLEIRIDEKTGAVHIPTKTFTGAQMMLQDATFWSGSRICVWIDSQIY